MAKSNISKVGSYLIINTNDDHPSIISEKTGVIPTEMVVKGDPFRSVSGKIINEKLNENNLWILKTNKIYSSKSSYSQLNKSITILLNTLDERRNIFLELLCIYGNSSIKSYGYFREETNANLFLDNNLLKKLVEYNLKLEFDLYLGITV